MAALSGRRACGALCLLAALATACDSPLDERRIELNAAGRALFALFLDNNLNGVFDQFDSIVPNGTIIVRRVGVQLDSASFTTDATGLALTGTLDVGRYIATIGRSVRGDTLVGALDSVTFTVIAGDTVPVSLGVQYPKVGIRAFRALQSGRRSWVRGVVLNNPGTFGDSTMHVQDDSAAIRLINLRVNLGLSAGDTVDVLGTRRARDGMPAVEALILVPRGGGLNPPPIELTTAQAATAQDTTRDAAFVAVRNAAVTDTATTFTARLLTVNDGSGPVRIWLHPAINPQGLMVIGQRLDVLGVLVPDPARSAWVLKPRFRADITIRVPAPPGGSP